MATWSRFEEIEAWQRARELTREIYGCSKTGPFSRDFGLRDQVRDAAISVMSNIAEGFGRRGTQEFLQFLSYACGSSTEVESELYVALDQEYIDLPTFTRLQAQVQRTRYLILGLMEYLRGCGIRGSKYRTDSVREIAPQYETPVPKKKRSAEGKARSQHQKPPNP
ncbi:MAG: four helix bundle protein [Planctomycetes bacterium]|nr:four helix bundle protein [Planctomycetota bacterium]